MEKIREWDNRIQEWYDNAPAPIVGTVWCLEIIAVLSLFSVAWVLLIW